MLSKEKIACIKCGRETERKSYNQKYCSECKVLIARERARHSYAQIRSTEEGRQRLREMDRKRKYAAYHKDVELARQKMRDYRLKRKAQKVS